jgi:TP901 family phage tail tape measure protein
MSNLTDKARELGATTLFTATQAAEGMKFLTLAGFEALEVYQAIEPALNLAAAGMLDLGQAADIVSNIMAAFSVDASRTEEVVDALAFTAARTNTNIQQLGEAMKFVGPVAGTLGVNVQETSVALGILGNSGLQASLAGTSLRRVMSGLLNPSKEAQKIFADMGVTQEQLVDTLQGEKGIVNLIDLLAKKGIDAADAFTLFGQRGAPGLLSLVNQREKLRKLTDDLEDIEGVAKRMARILADNLGGDGRIALSALQEAILQLGEAGLTEWLRSVTQGFTGFIRGVSGVQTPVEDLTASMEKGIRIGEKFRKNWDLIRNVALGLAIVLSRNLIVSLARTILMFGTNAIAALTSFALSMRGASIATVLLTGTLNLLKTALVTTGLGALVVGIGYLADWILFSDDAADSTTEFADKLDLLRKEATDAAFAFDAFGEARRKAALVTLEARLVAEQTALRDATNQLRSYQSAQESQEALIARVADAQQRFNEELGKGAGSSEFNEAQQRLEFYQDQLSRLKTLLETTDPIQLAAKIEELQENVKLAAEDLAAANKVMDGTASSMADARGEIEGTTKAMQEFIDEFKKLTGLEQADALSFKELLEEAEPAAKAIAEVQEKMDLLTKVAALTDTQLEKLGVTKAQLAKVEALLAHEMEEATAKMNDQEKAAKKVADEAQKIIDRLYPMRTLTREYYREAEQLTAEMIRQGDSMEEVREALLRLRAEYDENIKKLEETCEKNREVRECTEDSAKRIQQIWEQSMRNIQDAFADFFRNGLSDFDNFADSLLDAFKDMIANMLAAWFASGLMNIFQGKAFGAGGNSLMSGVGSLFGGGGSGGGGTGVSGIGTAIKGMSKAFSTFAVNAAFFFEGAKQFLMGNATSTQLGAVSGYAGAGAAVAGAGLGAASGFVVDSIASVR